jgi:hypothetical protein
MNPRLRCRFVLRRRAWLELHSDSDSPVRRAMAIAALKQKPRLKMFHATVHVTRVEEWCVEAESADEARELLASGGAHRVHVGDCVNLDIESVED